MMDRMKMASYPFSALTHTCPFCGASNDDLEMWRESECWERIYYYVRCSFCGGRGPEVNTANGAVEDWNMRGRA